MAQETFLGLDIGTSSVKALLIDGSQRVLAVGNAGLDVLRPRPLWSEQDPLHWWAATIEAVRQVREAAPESWRDLAGIGLSGQQHGATLLGADGAPLRPAILWNDGRSFLECHELMAAVPDFLERCGHIPMPGFTAPKILWVRKHEPEIFARIAHVLLPKDYVRFRLTGDLVSDMSDASGTWWLDIGKRQWDSALLEGTGLTVANMPGLVEGSEISAYLSADLAAAWGVAGRVPVAGGGGDNPASAVGIGAARAGQGFLTLGTSGVMFAVTDRFVPAPARTLHAFCHALPGRWHAMSVHLSAASALSWVADLVGSGQDISALLGRVEAWAAIPGNAEHAPVFLPYLSGERTPHNDPEASGMFAGLRAQHGAEALVYAVLEGVAFSIADGQDVLHEGGAHIDGCLLVGGGARSTYWAQMISDILGIELLVPEGAEIGAAFGAARLAMLAAGAGSEDAICTQPPVRNVFRPGPDRHASRLARFRALYPAERATRGG